MRGLILKDLYALRSFWKQFVFIYLFIACAFSASAAESGSVSFVLTSMMIYSVVFGSTVLLSSMSMDEAVSFNRYALTTPLGIKKIVKAKFVLLLLTIAVGVFVSLLICGALSLLPAFKGEMIEWSAIIAAMALFLIGDSFMIAVMFKKGVEKARYIYIIIMFALAVFVFGCAKICEMKGISFRILEQLPDVFLSFIAAAVAALSMLISYFVTLRIVRKKEW